MYNGQYAKGVAHLVIFAVVDTLQNNVNGIFSILVAAWVIYQMIDAYQTAKARRDGTALPNAFGLNDIGDRMGFGRNWPGSSTRPVTGSTTAGWASAAAGAATAPPPPGATGPGWTGYVPPTNFGATATPPPVPPPPYAEPSAYAQSAGSGAAAAQGAAWTQAPYVNTYAGEPWASAPGGPVPPLASIAAVPPSRRFPVGAAWLIGLGLIFLLTNLNADWRLNGAWIAAITLGALGSWMLYRRVEMVRAWAKVSGDADAADAGIAPRLICQIRWPIMLLILALLFVLQAAGVRTLGQTWGVLLIAFGAMLILERVVGRSQWYPMTMPGGSAATPAADAVRKDGR
jgi:hypothetical protein